MILAATDMGADGVELLIHLDEAHTAPDGTPDPTWVWRTVVPADQWRADEAAAILHAAGLAEGEARRRRPVELPELRGKTLA